LEHIVCVLDSITVVIRVDSVTDVISVKVIRDVERRVRIGLAIDLIDVGPTVLVVIGIGVVTYAVAIIILPFLCIQWECIGVVKDRVSIVVVVSIVADAVAIGVNPLTCVEREGINNIGETVVVVIAVLGVARAVLVGVRRQRTGIQRI
jgi:hypothetical protein